MLNKHFIKIGLVVPEISLGNPKQNAENIIKMIKEDTTKAILLFPELTITGYSLGDWFFNRQLIDDSNEALDYILANNDHLIIIGHLLECRGSLYNVALVIDNNKIIGAVPKLSLPHHHEFNDTRYFNDARQLLDEFKNININGQVVPFGELIFKDKISNFTFGVEICADLWHSNSPSNKLYAMGAEVIFNPSASTFQIGKAEKRINLCQNASLRSHGGYAYVSTGASETSSDVIYTGHQIYCECGEIIFNNEPISFENRISYVDIDIEKIKYNRIVNGWYNEGMSCINIIPFTLQQSFDHLDILPNKYPFITNDKDSMSIIDIVTSAIYKRLKHIGITDVVIGISGGLDSTLSLLMCVEAFKRFNIPLNKIHAITMPGLATSTRSLEIAEETIKQLDVDAHKIIINQEVIDNLTLIGHDTITKDITFENAQARYRTLVLMNFANKINGIVIGTGDMSEIALGWSTFNGDHMSMYNPNAGLPKTAVRNLVKFFQKLYPELSNCLKEVINNRITPELTDETQDTESIIGRYEINDFIMYQVLANGSSKERLLILLVNLFDLSYEEADQYYNNFIKRFKAQQYKRLSGPEGVKIFAISLSPRNDLRLPGDLK